MTKGQSLLGTSEINIKLLFGLKKTRDGAVIPNTCTECNQPRFLWIVIGGITMTLRMKILDMIDKEEVRNLAIL